MDILIITKKDNVAVALKDLKKGSKIELPDKVPLPVLDDIPTGHKIALANIPKGGEVIKYGEVIGRATQEIKRGMWVHVHNVESERGRGDVHKREVE
ncbi:MAG: UxaA family hydrolase [Candidatus Micrarchaeaceae archaeon]